MNQMTVVSENLPPEVESRGITPEAWRVMNTVLYPSASDEMTLILHDYCKARKLDPLKKPFHIVNVWDSKKSKMVENIWPSINEGRITAMRTGEYAGMDAIEHGGAVRQKVGDIEMSFPEWAQCTIYRIVSGHRCAFAGPRVYWLETYAKKKGTDPTPNYMWARRPFGQIDKCAEASALRVAFPEENSMPTAEEMEGQTVGFNNAKDVTPPTPDPVRRSASKAGKKTPPVTELAGEHDPATGEMIDDDPLSGLGDELPPEEMNVWLGRDNIVISHDIKDATMRMVWAMKQVPVEDRSAFLASNAWACDLEPETQNYLSKVASGEIN